MGHVDGILILDKPRDITSMDVVRRVKRTSGQKRVGHGGTLDPIATGVVPIYFGQATRVMEYVVEGTKDYEGTVELGVATDTYDSEGTVTERSDATHLSVEQIETALESFVGAIEQVPPMYSALKRKGKRLYQLARAGIEVEREPRSVNVSSLELVSWSPPVARVRLSCGRGFYVRSFAHDLGQKLGCGGHLTSLVRLRSGPFRICDALPLEEAELRMADGSWEDALLGTDAAMLHMRVAVVGRRLEEMIRNGRPVAAGLRVPDTHPDEHCRAYTVDGRFIAILAFDSSMRHWRPHKVFTLSYPDEADSGLPSAPPEP